MKKLKKILDVPVVFLINVFIKYIDKSREIRKNEYWAGRVLEKWMDRSNTGGCAFHVAWFHPKYESLGMRKDLRAHELWHLQQQAGEPLVVFLAKYVGKYLYNRIVKKMNHYDAYLNISYEIEARERAGQE